MLTLLADLTPASAVCLSISVYAAASIPVLLVPADVDPRPAVRRATKALHQGAVHAVHDANRVLAPAERRIRPAAHASHEAFRDAVALLILLTTRPQGATR